MSREDIQHESSGLPTTLRRMLGEMPRSHREAARARQPPAPSAAFRLPGLGPERPLVLPPADRYALLPELALANTRGLRHTPGPTFVDPTSNSEPPAGGTFHPETKNYYSEGAKFVVLPLFCLIALLRQKEL